MLLPITQIFFDSIYIPKLFTQNLIFGLKKGKIKQQKFYPKIFTSKVKSELFEFNIGIIKINLSLCVYSSTLDAIAYEQSTYTNKKINEVPN